MTMFTYFFCLCPLSLTIKLNFDISKVAYWFLALPLLFRIKSPYNKKNITHWLEDMNFMFSWQEQYLTRSLCSLVRYCSCHSHIKFISSCHGVISFIYFVQYIEYTPIWLNRPFLGCLLPLCHSESSCGTILMKIHVYLPLGSFSSERFCTRTCFATVAHKVTQKVLLQKFV